MVEPEIAFADINANADLAEDLLRYSFRAVLDERADDMAFFAERIDKDAVSRLEAFVASSFARMEYTEAIEILQRSGRAWEFPVEWGVALQAEHERYLCEEYAKRPVVVVNYPKQIKAFYMRLNDDERTVAAIDVLAPGIGGSSAAASARSASTSSMGAFARRVSIPRRTGGTATCAGTAPCRTPGSASGSIGQWPTRRGPRTSGTSFRSRARPEAPTSDRAAGLRRARPPGADARPLALGRRQATMEHATRPRVAGPCGLRTIPMALSRSPAATLGCERSPCSTRAGSPDRFLGAASVRRFR